MNNRFLLSRFPFKPVDGGNAFPLSRSVKKTDKVEKSALELWHFGRKYLSSVQRMLLIVDLFRRHTSPSRTFCKNRVDFVGAVDAALVIGL